MKIRLALVLLLFGAVVGCSSKATRQVAPAVLSPTELTTAPTESPPSAAETAPPAETVRQAEAAKPEATKEEGEQEDKSRLLGEIVLSTPESSYTVGTAVPLTLTFKVGKFDLLLGQRYIVGDGAFANLIVLDSAGKPPARKQIISISKATSSLYFQGQRVAAIPGLELTAGAKHTASLPDLGELYDLKPGSYTVQAKLHLPVYRGPKIPEQSPAIAQMEEEIVLLQRDRKLSADAKADAIAELRRQIQELRAEQPDTSDEYFVDVANLRGYADLESNVLKIHITE